jgi:hypothetical protein
MNKLILTPRELAMAERSRACEEEIVKSLERHRCRLGVKDVIMDGRLVERTVSPVPIELDIPRPAMPATGQKNEEETVQ